MAGLGGTDFDNAMKTFYLDPLNDQVYRSSVLLDRLEKNSEDVSGNFAYVPLISARNPAIGSRTEPASSTGVGALLPEAGRQSYDKATFKMIMHYGRGSVSGGIMRKSRNDRGAFARALDIEMKGLMKSLPEDLNRDLCGMGNGRAFTLGKADATTTWGKASTVFAAYADGNFRCRVGDRVAYVDITAGAATAIFPAASLCTVAGINFWQDEDGDSSATYHKVTLTPTPGSTCTTAVGTFYFGGSSANSTSLNEAVSRAQTMLGMQALIDDGDIGITGEGETVASEDGEVAYGTIATGVGGIDRDVNPFWQANVDHNSGTKRALTQTLLMQMHLTLSAQNGGSPEMVEGYCHPSVWGTLGMIQVGSRIYNDFKDTVKMGWTYIDFNGSKVFYDRDMPNNKLYFICMEDVFILTQGGYEFMDDDGKVVRIAAGGTRDAWEFSIVRDIQLGMRRARGCGVVKDLKTTMNVDGARH